MSITQDGDTIGIVGAGRSEAAETLAGLLAVQGARPVDLTRAGPLHAAVLQVLLAFRPRLLGPAGDPFVAAWLLPALVADGAAAADLADTPQSGTNASQP